MENWKSDLTAAVVVLVTIIALMMSFHKSKEPVCTGPVDTLFTDCVDNPAQFSPYR